MRTSINYLILCFIIGMMNSCDNNETVETISVLDEFEATKYFDAEIFSQDDLKIYGKWKIFKISGGFSGGGHDVNFDYLEIKEYGIYGFVKNDSLLEYGKISPATQTTNEIVLKVNLEKDENSNSFFIDGVKYVHFFGSDTLSLNSPCCDRYNYHFERQ